MKRLFSGTTRARTTRRKSLAIEQLEDRLVLSTVPAQPALLTNVVGAAPLMATIQTTSDEVVVLADGSAADPAADAGTNDEANLGPDEGQATEASDDLTTFDEGEVVADDSAADPAPDAGTNDEANLTQEETPITQDVTGPEQTQPGWDLSPIDPWAGVQTRSGSEASPPSLQTAPDLLVSFGTAPADFAPTLSGANLRDPAPRDADGFQHDYPQGIKVLANVWDPALEGRTQVDATSMVVGSGNADTYLKDMFHTQWDGQKIQRNDDQGNVIKDENGSPVLRTHREWALQETLDKLGKDLQDKADLHVTDSSGFLAGDGELLFRQLGPNRMELRYRLTGNSVTFTVEVPSGIRRAAALAAGAAAAEEFGVNWAAAAVAFGVAYDRVMSAEDPRFTATFDVEMVMELDVASSLDPDRVSNLYLPRAEVKILNANIDSDNTFADLVKDVDGALQVVGSPGIFAPALRAMQERGPGGFGKEDLVGAFVGINQALQQAAANGFTQATTRVVDEAPFGKVVLELTQDVTQKSLHLNVKSLDSSLGGTDLQQGLVKTYVAVWMDGVRLKSMESHLFDPAIQPWVSDASPDELALLKWTGTNFGANFDTIGRHNIHIEVWRSVRSATEQATVLNWGGRYLAVYENSDQVALPDNFASLSLWEQQALTTRAVAPPPGVVAGRLGAFDLTYDFKTQRITGAFGTAGPGEDIVLRTGGEAPATLTITLGEDAVGKWTPAHEEAPVPPNEEMTPLVPNPDPEPGWDPWSDPESFLDPEQWGDDRAIVSGWDSAVIQPDAQMAFGDEVWQEPLQAGVMGLGQDVSLNPQPLPPRVGDALDATSPIAAVTSVSMGSVTQSVVSPVASALNISAIAGVARLGRF